MHNFILKYTHLRIEDNNHNHLCTNNCKTEPPAGFVTLISRCRVRLSITTLNQMALIAGVPIAAPDCNPELNPTPITPASEEGVDFRIAMLELTKRIVQSIEPRMNAGNSYSQ